MEIIERIVSCMNTDIIEELNGLLKGLICDPVVTSLPDNQTVQINSRIINSLKLQMIAVLLTSNNILFYILFMQVTFCKVVLLAFKKLKKRPA